KIFEQLSSGKHDDDIESDHHQNRNQNHLNHQTSHLLCSFVWWTALSLISSLLIATGFWLPYWLKGTYQDDNQIEITFSPFRRCNYPIIDNDGNINLMFKCIHYEHFDDIPSISWKLTTLLVGLGVLFSILVALILLFACCMPNALTSSNTCLLVVAQILISKSINRDVLKT
ncbi:hypothetical protein BLA29_011602, partial [Euroglyphus maynei]